MRKIIFFFVIIAVGFFLQWNGILEFMGMLEKQVVTILDYRSFSSDFKTMGLFIALSLLLLILYLPGAETTRENNSSAKQWLSTFLVLIGISIVLVTFTNPEGRFPWNKRDAYISVAARAIKPGLYRSLTTTPDLILFGSSVSFTIPADQLKEKWNIDTFNMALNGGAPNDFLQMLKFVIETSPNKQAPLAVTVEILRRDLGTTSGSLTPLELVPYMELDQGVVAVFAAMDDTIKLSPVSDSVFTLLFVDHERWQTAVNFSPDGSGNRTSKTISPANYRQSLAKNVGLLDGLLSCKNLNPTGVEYIEKLVALGREYKFGVVFYTAPINSDFYILENIRPARYEPCRRLLNEYMQEIASQNPNMFFRDLSSYEPISTQGLKTYIDTHHLTENGSILLLDELHIDIESAMQWAVENR